MSKAVMISIKPQWCELIAKKQKTIEVRKTRPKLETPFKCYIYMTKSNLTGNRKAYKDRMAGKVIGEFVCDFINEYTAEFVKGDYYEDIRQIFDEGETIIASNEDENLNNCFLCNKSCLTFEEIKKYIGYNFHEKPFYGWHISDLVIYDKPKELYEFDKPCTDPYQYCQGCKHGLVQYPSDVETYEDLAGCCFDTVCLNQLQKPPQSWCYVEAKE